LRKLTLALVLALIATVPIHAKGLNSNWKKADPWFSDHGFVKGNSDPACDPTTVPEPSGFMMLGAGLLVLGGLAAFRHKRAVSNQ
jgi:hypothetical protein